MFHAHTLAQLSTVHKNDTSHVVYVTQHPRAKHLPVYARLCAKHMRYEIGEQTHWAATPVSLQLCVLATVSETSGIF